MTYPKEITAFCIQSCRQRDGDDKILNTFDRQQKIKRTFLVK